MGTNRNPKGTVAVEEFAGRLRLRWRHLGKRYVIPVGLPDSISNRKVAQQRAIQIELDIKAGKFDQTLVSYKPHIPEPSSMTIPELFEDFLKSKSKSVTLRSLEKYTAALKHLEKFHGDKIYTTAIANIDEKSVEKFYDWFLTRKLQPRTTKERLSCIREVWAFAVEKNYLTENPWQSIPNRVKVPPKQKPKPFTVEEIKTIISSFRKNRYYSYYTDYVEFLFLTGCRTAEVIGLRWKHITDDFSSIWIGESLSRGVRKSTKTNRDRTIPINPDSRLQKLLINRKPKNPKKDDLVFPAKNGGAIDDHNFRNRAWVSILEQAGIEYRKPYNTRHTFISHALKSGTHPLLVAKLTGHDVKTLYEYYADCIDSSPRLPDYLN
ncbi:MAG: tyrosine-type recombinase/integrase [Microcoleaceae cyanobacterium]